MTNSFSTLVLSGGSLKCTALIGCVKYLEEHGMLKDVNQFIGTSAGSIVALFLALGYSSDDLLESTYKFLDWQKLYEPNIDNIINIYYSLGLDDGSIITRFIAEVLEKQIGQSDVTFEELLSVTGKDVVISSCKLNDMQEVFMSASETPTLSVIQAIRASTAIPIIFTPVEIQGELYIDAGVIAKFPISYLKENDQINHALGLNIGPSTIRSNSDEMNLAQFVFQLINQSTKKMNMFNLIDPEMCVVNINVDAYDQDNMLNFDFATMEFKISKETINQYIDIGYNSMTEHFKTMKSVVPDLPVV